MHKKNVQIFLKNTINMQLLLCESKTKIILIKRL